MGGDLPVHEFDPGAATRYRSRAEFVKTAVLLELAEDQDEVRIIAPFGTMVMRGPFYVVGEGDGSYGAARAEFESAHEQIGPHRWVKRSMVEAYPAVERCLVETRLADGSLETSNVAEPGDWIVRQANGEVMVVKPEGFDERYEAAE